MALLRRKKKKKDEDEEIDEVEEGEDSKKTLKKKPQKRKPRKKAPPKEWGKRERMWVLGVFMATILVSGLLAMSARSWKLPGFPRIKKPELSGVNLLSKETIVIDTNDKNVEVQEKITESFIQKTDQLSGVYGLYIVHLADGFSFGVNHTEEFEPASLNKLPVMYASLTSSTINLDETYVLRDSDKIGGSGSLSLEEDGTQKTYRELVALMGKESDNTAFNVMRRIVGNDVISKTTRDLGMNKTSYEENTTSPEDIGTFFKRVYWKKSSETDELLSFLTDTIYEEYLPNGLPTEVRVAHKYGREVHVINDAGIVFSDNPYVIVIMSKGVIEKEADRVIPEISKMVYDYETNK